MTPREKKCFDNPFLQVYRNPLKIFMDVGNSSNYVKFSCSCDRFLVHHQLNHYVCRVLTQIWEGEGVRHKIFFKKRETKARVHTHTHSSLVYMYI